MNTLEEIYAQSSAQTDYFRKYSDYVQKLLSEIDTESVKYTMKTINSIGLIKNRVKEVMLDLYKDGVRDFHYFGNPDINILVEMVFKEEFDGDCSFFVQTEIPKEKINGVLLICKEDIDEEGLASHKYVDLIRELAKENHLINGRLA